MLIVNVECFLPSLILLYRLVTNLCIQYNSQPSCGHMKAVCREPLWYSLVIGTLYCETFGTQCLGSGHCLPTHPHPHYSKCNCPSSGITVSPSYHFMTLIASVLKAEGYCQSLSVFFGKLTDFGCFPLDAILSNVSVACHTPSVFNFISATTRMHNARQICMVKYSYLWCSACIAHVCGG